MGTVPFCTCSQPGGTHACHIHTVGPGPAVVDLVNHPAHYGGKDNPYEAIKVIEAWGLGFCLGNTVKYISRVGLKDPNKVVEDLEKARWYLDREIERRKKA